MKNKYKQILYPLILIGLSVIVVYFLIRFTATSMHNSDYDEEQKVNGGFGQELYDEPVQLSKNEIILSTYDYPPYQFMDTSRFSFFIEVVEAACDAADLQLTIKYLPWDRGMHLVDNGEIHGTFPYLMTEERLERYDFSNPFIDMNMQLTRLFYHDVYNNFSNDFITDISQLEGYQFGAMRNYWYGDYLENHVTNIDYSHDEVLMFKKLAAGRVDLVPGDYFVAKYLIQENMPEELNYIKTLDVIKEVFSEEQRIMIDKNNVDKKWLLERLNYGIKTVQDDGTYERLYEKFIALYDYPQVED